MRCDVVMLGRCRLYLGNDTGTMHLAAAAGTRCVAVFSSKDWPGIWYPYGTGHRVLRTAVECDGCRLTECIERRMECILSIAVEDVYRAAADLLKTFSQRPTAGPRGVQGEFGAGIGTA